MVTKVTNKISLCLPSFILTFYIFLALSFCCKLYAVLYFTQFQFDFLCYYLTWSHLFIFVTNLNYKFHDLFLVIIFALISTFFPPTCDLCIVLL
jgi:hypothetical protein